ncbi:MAG: hypothetical protein GC159_00050 [Phycisphaera sp.]|nr:hypothetical protein [Phycisphaera sp.]
MGIVKDKTNRPIGKAIRFLLNRHTGLLLTDDPVTRRPNVTYIRYTPNARGDLVAQIPANSPHATALERSARSVLCVSAGQPSILGPVDDENWELPSSGISNVQAAVRTETFAAPNPLYIGVRMRIRGVQALFHGDCDDVQVLPPVI